VEFRIADTFTGSLAKLAGDEQKAVKTTAFDLQLNPASPGMQLHKLDRARDKNFWSVRVNLNQQPSRVTNGALSFDAVANLSIGRTLTFQSAERHLTLRPHG
jgi:hypothetical protein